MTSDNELATHELAHCAAAIIGNMQGTGITNDRQHWTAWSNGSFSSDIDRTAFAIAGPLAELAILGLIGTHTPLTFVLKLLDDHLAADNDGSTDNDAARFTRFRKKLTNDELMEAVAKGTKAGLAAYSIYRNTANIAGIAAAIAALAQSEVLVIRPADLIALLRKEPVTLNVHRLNDWLIETAETELEARAEAFGILAEFVERGEIRNGMLTPAGLARLSLNEG